MADHFERRMSRAANKARTMGKSGRDDLEGVVSNLVATIAIATSMNILRSHEDVLLQFKFSSPRPNEFAIPGGEIDPLSFPHSFENSSTNFGRKQRNRLWVRRKFLRWEIRTIVHDRHPKKCFSQVRQRALRCRCQLAKLWLPALLDHLAPLENLPRWPEIGSSSGSFFHAPLSCSILVMFDCRVCRRWACHSSKLCLSCSRMQSGLCFFIAQRVMSLKPWVGAQVCRVLFPGCRLVSFCDCSVWYGVLPQVSWFRGFSPWLICSCIAPASHVVSTGTGA